MFDLLTTRRQQRAISSWSSVVRGSAASCLYSPDPYFHRYPRYSHSCRFEARTTLAASIMATHTAARCQPDLRSRPHSWSASLPAVPKASRGHSNQTHGKWQAAAQQSNQTKATGHNLLFLGLISQLLAPFQYLSIKQHYVRADIPESSAEKVNYPADTPRMPIINQKHTNARVTGTYVLGRQDVARFPGHLKAGLISRRCKIAFMLLSIVIQGLSL